MKPEELLDYAMKALATGGDIRTIDLPGEVAKKIYSTSSIPQPVADQESTQEPQPDMVPQNDLEDKYIRAAQGIK